MAYSGEDGEAKRLAKLFTKVLLGKIGCHYGVTCDSCLTKNMFGYRYKCAVCDDYDLCTDCFEDRKESKKHQVHHPMQVIRSPDVYFHFRKLFKLGLPNLQSYLCDNDVTHDMVCNPCSKRQKVTGLLFICDDCRGYRLCYNCFKTGKVSESHSNNHCLIIQVTPNDYEYQGANITLLKELGEGSFGEVYMCDINGERAAIKLCHTKNLEKMSINEKQTLENEIKVYQEFFCNYIVEIKGFGIGTGDRLFLVLEYLSEGTLQERLSSKSYKDISKRRRFLFCQNVIRGLFRMHKKDIIHKDLKPENIFLTDHDTVKLGDLGIAFHPDCTSQGVQRIHQAEYYPTNNPNSCHQSYDLFAFGLVFNEIMTGQKNLKLTQDDCKNPRKVPYFGPMISACLSESGRDRPTTSCIKQHILDFHEHLDTYLEENDIDYESEKLGKRNEIFDRAYHTFATKNKFTKVIDETYQERPSNKGKHNYQNLSNRT